MNSAFIGTDMKTQLSAAQVQSAVIDAATTNRCVEPMTRMASSLNFGTWPGRRRSRCQRDPHGNVVDPALRIRRYGDRLVDHESRLTRPSNFPDRERGRVDRSVLAFTHLLQHRRRGCILASRIEPHTIPRHDRLIAGHVGCAQRRADG